MDQSEQNTQVLVQKSRGARILILNRPKQLNALSHSMITRLLDSFLEYEQDDNVTLIILKGTGRAFCAGGDVTSVVRDSANGNWKRGASFFRKEFTFNYVTATCGKPQVSILNGTVMGGGAGASMLGQFRVATENTIFSMPETILGLFPDVGATYFLSRLPGFLGEYLGLTGARLDGPEMLRCGLATHFVKAERLPEIEEALSTLNTGNSTKISSVLDEFSYTPALKRKSDWHRLPLINKCFSRRTVEDILSALEKARPNEWAVKTIELLKKASPTSLKICLKSIREGRMMGVGQCLVQEYRIVSNVLRGQLSWDFYEGCRALLIDKDKSPKWAPSRLEDVSESTVNQYFCAIEDGEWEDLNFPVRKNVPSFAFAKL